MDVTEESSSELESDDTSDDVFGETRPPTPGRERLVRKARISYVRLEGLIMENRGANTDSPRRTTRRKNQILVSDTSYVYSDPVPRRRPSTASPRKLDTARKRLWDEIARKTQVKTNGFIVANKDLFLPLLPINNYVSKLVAAGQQPSVVKYERLPAQPKGVTANLKPYQVEGLSFLVHLHNNGFSGILSDEMGLGKTLQTLSLFQYLEEKDQKEGVLSEESRPYLVICPLSVLNSWINEAQKVSVLHTTHLRTISMMMILVGAPAQSPALSRNTE